MSRKEEISIIIQEILKNYSAEDEVINGDICIEKDLYMDSLDHIEIVLEIENKFNITIPDNEITQIVKGTVNELVEYVYQKTKSK